MGNKTTTERYLMQHLWHEEGRCALHLHPLLWSFPSCVGEIIWSWNVQNSFQIPAWLCDFGCRSQPKFVLQLITQSNPLQQRLQTTSSNSFNISAMQMTITSSLWFFSDELNLSGDTLKFVFFPKSPKKRDKVARSGRVGSMTKWQVYPHTNFLGAEWQQ